MSFEPRRRASQVVRAGREEGRNDMNDAIDVKSLKKSYKTLSVLDDVSFSVKKGKVFALLGSNGAGKTTTINILTTLIKADGGTATVAGHDVSARPDRVRKEISLTGQFAAVDDRLTGRENLLLIGRLRHVPDPTGTATDLLRRFGLEDAADRRVATFSGGMRRRLDIAMSLIGSPSVVFLDEPTSGFDPEARNEMWRTIRELAEGGTTVFLTTQYLDEADELADDIAVLHRGRIVASGTAGELKKLVPGGLVELTFHDEATRDAAAEELGRSYACSKGEGATLTITTDGTVAGLAGVFTDLRDAGIEPAEFSRKEASLDDAFLKIIGSDREEE
jgi:ABC-2 type transport system ATP-binding protein